MNSRPWEDKPARSAYKLAWPECEIACMFPTSGKHMVRVPVDETHGVHIHRHQPACDVHHITTNPRWDLTTNFISLSRPAHDFCHRWKADGMTLALAAKLKKNELDWSILDRITHVNLAEWLKSHELRWEWIEPIRERVLKHRNAELKGGAA